MPELPEVHRACKIFRKEATGKYIVNVNSIPDKIVYKNCTNLEFDEKMLGRVVERVERYGKYFYVSFKDTGPKLLLHLGMTGDILIENGEPHFYKAPKIKYGQSWPPKYMKFEFSLSSSEHGKPETRISFCDARRLGSIYLISGDPRTTHPIMNLGYDPLVNPPSVDEFVQLVYSKNTQIKAFLLDQHNIAGIGNWIADEVLYQSKIHPKKSTMELSEPQIKTLLKVIFKVIKFSVSVDSDDSYYPKSWLFHYRWDKRISKSKNGAPKVEGNRVEYIKVGGRTTAFVPSVQIL